MGVDRDEFSGDDPNSFDAARAAADAPIGDPLNPEARVGDEPLVDAATDGKSNGNGAAHVDGEFTEARKILQASRARRPHSSTRTGPTSTSTSTRFSIQTS